MEIKQNYLSFILGGKRLWIETVVSKEHSQGAVSFRSKNRQIQAGFQDCFAKKHLETILVKVQI